MTAYVQSFPGVELSATSTLKNRTRGTESALFDTSKPDLNGFLINQNNISSTTYSSSNILSEKLFVQEFKLPSNILRGQKCPNLTGLHFHLKANSATFTISYDLQVYDKSYGWTGVLFGAYDGVSAGSKWVQINFDSVAISSKYLNQKFRLIVRLDSGVDGLYYSSSNIFKSNKCYLYQNKILQSTERALRFRLIGDVADEGTDILGNQYRSLVYTQSINETLDYNSNTWWMSKANPSKYAVESLYFNLGEKATVDAIFLDPASPNMHFNVYYSDEVDDPTSSVDGWDNILWKRIPKDFIANKKQNYILPTPVSTKFIKIEFTSLQAKPYLTGDFQKPITYKKYPQWVFDYFITRYAHDRDMTYDPFIANEVEINFDVLSLAFNYYKNDITQYSTKPNEIKVVNEKAENLDQTLRNLLVKNTDNSKSLDVQTYMKIKTKFDSFLSHPSLNSDGNSQAGITSIANANFTNYPVEDRISTVGLTSIVSNHNREHLIQEKQMPHMYFFIDCRHAYKEALAKLPDSKAYFAGVKEIGFQRHDHKVVSDSSVYLSVAGENLNLMINDFDYDGVAWVSK